MKDEKGLLPAVIERILVWYRGSRRSMPWRDDPSPYHVWLSEIMLQQTRIEAAAPCYRRFLGELPTVEALAACGEEKLMKLWQGLGYYSRARNLKKAAQSIMNDFGGEFPKRYAQIVTLAGIGEYTAGAIASICFNEKVTAVDGNVLRVITRVIGDRSNVLLPDTKKRIAAMLLPILPEQAGEFNEALMELGEVVCLPNGAPDCERCPIRQHCTAYREHLTAQIPVRIRQMKRKHAEKTVFLITDANGRLAIEKRPDTGLLPGLYQLPNIDGYYSQKELYKLLGDWGLTAISLEFSKEAKHVFTHIDWYMKAYRVTAEQPNERFLWVTKDELRSAYPLPTAFLKLLR